MLSFIRNIVAFRHILLQLKPWLMLSATLLVLPLVNAPQNAYAQQVLAEGTFVGKSGHKVSGKVQLVKTDKGTELRLLANFKSDGAPGPYIGFGKNGHYSKRTEFSRLKKRNGMQSYRVPAKLDISSYNNVFIWCKPYNVPLAIAALKRK